LAGLFDLHENEPSHAQEQPRYGYRRKKAKYYKQARSNHPAYNCSFNDVHGWPFSGASEATRHQVFWQVAPASEEKRGKNEVAAQFELSHYPKRRREG